MEAPGSSQTILETCHREEHDNPSIKWESVACDRTESEHSEINLHSEKDTYSLDNGQLQSPQFVIKKDEKSGSLPDLILPDPVGHIAPHPLPPPKDKYFLVWIVFLLNSGSFWLAWNLMNFLGNTYYFDYWFSTSLHVPSKYANDFLNALGMLACSPLFAMGYIAFIPLFPFTKIPMLYRYALAISVYLITIMILLIASCTWKSNHQTLDMGSFFTFSVTIILIMMGAVGLVQSYLYGMAADLPRVYTSAIVIGSNAGGVLATLLYIICTPSKQTWNAEVSSAKVYYTVTFVYLVICMASLFILWKSNLFRHYMHSRETKNKAVNCQPKTFCKDIGQVVSQAWSELLGIFMIFFTMYAIFPTLSVGIQPGNTPGMAHLPKYFLQLGTFLNFYGFATVGAVIAAFINFPAESKLLRRLLLIPSYVSMYIILFFMFCNYYPNPPQIRTAKIIFKGEWWYFIGNGFLGLLVGTLSGVLIPLCSRVVKPELRRLAGQMALASLLSGKASSILCIRVDLRRGHAAQQFLLPSPAQIPYIFQALLSIIRFPAIKPNSSIRSGRN